MQAVKRLAALLPVWPVRLVRLDVPCLPSFVPASCASRPVSVLHGHRDLPPYPGTILADSPHRESVEEAPAVAAVLHQHVEAELQKRILTHSPVWCVSELQDPVSELLHRHHTLS